MSCHLVRLREQGDFLEESLDVSANVIALGATSHAKVYLAVEAVIEIRKATPDSTRVELLK